MKEITKLALISARRVFNKDDQFEEDLYCAGFEAGFRKAREMAASLVTFEYRQYPYGSFVDPKTFCRLKSQEQFANILLSIGESEVKEK